MNKIIHINRNTNKSKWRWWKAMSKELMLLIKQALESSNLDVEVQIPNNFIEDDLTIEEALKQKENIL